MTPDAEARAQALLDSCRHPDYIGNMSLTLDEPKLRTVLTTVLEALEGLFVAYEYEQSTRRCAHNALQRLHDARRVLALFPARESQEAGEGTDG
jgi:hypothetical protein